MRFVNPLPFVADMARSKAFYQTLLQLQVIQDHGNFVLFANGFAIHDGNTLYQTVFGRPQIAAGHYGRNNLVLYFETDDLLSAFRRMDGQADLIHPIRTESWGQRVFRLWDPDRHIVEIGESQIPPANPSSDGPIRSDIA
jgi:catechol 2,3-dioxygenase-like lactoylglutathione lyase family enzyme